MLDDIYQDCQKRMIIIDQEGVIPMKTTHGKYEPTAEAIAALNIISDDPNNIVFVVSTESK
jgi:trehalose-6-phosphatase